MSMAITSSSATAGQSDVSGPQQARQDMEALAKALKSNDLDAAKSAYATLAKNAPAGATTDPNSPLTKVGQALQNGDLSGAQKALSSARPHHFHGGGRRAEGSSSSTSSSTTPTPSSPTETQGNNVNIYV